MTTILVVAAVATCYAGPYVDQPLFCGGTYDVEAADPWVALPVSEYGTGWHCGDWIYLRFENGTSLLARAMDAGPFGPYCVERDEGCLPIVVDVPCAFVPWLSAGVELYNLSAMARETGVERYVHWW